MTRGTQPVRAGVLDLSRNRRLRRRLAPLFAAVALQGMALWVPIEKLFMTGIGFDAASIGVLAAVYSVAVPLFEVPSGVLADRWSRRGVLLLGTAAAAASVIVGGLSQNVATYMVSALFLGMYFAMVSGTLDSVVYDTVLEETGGSDDFERMIGRMRLVESVALVGSALIGAAIAQVAPLPTTYFLTVIPLAGAGVALLAFREPRLHDSDERTSLRDQLRATTRTLLRRGRLRRVVALLVVGALLAQAMFEFGPLWLIALAVPAFLYGPHWAGLTAALGIGGLLGSRAWLTGRTVTVGLALLLVGSCVALAVSQSVWLIVLAQVLLVLVVVAVSIPATRRLHDDVTSSTRASVASGVGALTWLAFVPLALAMGFITERVGVASAGWLTAALAAVAGILMITVLPTADAVPAETLRADADLDTSPDPPAFPPHRFAPLGDPEWPGHWSEPPQVWDGIRLQSDEALAQLRSAIAALPTRMRRALVLRDVEGLSPGEAQAALGITARRERALVHQARGRVRAELERFLEERP